MRYIKRGNEPPSLARHRATIVGPITSAHYDNLPEGVRPDLERQLREEQGNLCGYCMSRLETSPANVRIDHWAPRGTSPQLSLTWGNLVLSCRGGERHGGAWAEPELPPYASAYHCDKKKGEDPVTISPLDPGVESQVRYLESGRIERAQGAPAALDKDLDETLNLNAEHLKRNRARVLKELRGFAQRRGVTPRFCEEQLRRWQTADADDKLTEYCGVVTWQLRKWQRRK